MIVMAVVGVALRDGLADLVAAQFMSIYCSRARNQPARAAGAPNRPNRSQFAKKKLATFGWQAQRGGAGRTGSVRVESQGEV